MPANHHRHIFTNWMVGMNENYPEFDIKVSLSDEMHLGSENSKMTVKSLYPQHVTFGAIFGQEGSVGFRFVS